MKRKHKDGIVAMGIKIAAMERLNRDHCIQISDSLQEITNLKRTLKLHGEAHMAQDLLPQFTELVKKVEKLEGQLNFKLNDGPIANHSKRIADLEETAESLSETVDQSTLSAKMFLERVTDIEILKTQMAGVEKTVYNSPFSKIVMEEYAENIKTLVRDVDTLKIQMHNLLPRPQ